MDQGQVSQWDWNKLVKSWEYQVLSLHGYPTWELIGGHPVCVMMECLAGIKDSRKIAILWDDELSFVGNFAYRDWTKSSLPFVEDGERYWSCFSFQKKKDAIEFQKRYGGVGSWQKEYDSFVKKCNDERNE